MPPSMVFSCRAPASSKALTAWTWAEKPRIAWNTSWIKVEEKKVNPIDPIHFNDLNRLNHQKIWISGDQIAVIMVIPMVFPWLSHLGFNEATNELASESLRGGRSRRHCAWIATVSLVDGLSLNIWVCLTMIIKYYNRSLMVNQWLMIIIYPY